MLLSQMEVKCCHSCVLCFYVFFSKKIQASKGYLQLFFEFLQRKQFFVRNESKAFIDTEKFVCLPFPFICSFACGGVTGLHGPVRKAADDDEETVQMNPDGIYIHK